MHREVLLCQMLMVSKYKILGLLEIVLAWLRTPNGFLKILNVLYIMHTMQIMMAILMITHIKLQNPQIMLWDHFQE